MHARQVAMGPVPRRRTVRTWWSDLGCFPKGVLILAMGAVLWAMVANWGFTPVLIGGCILAAVALAFRKWKWPTPGRRGWIVPIALAAAALVALLSYTPIWNSFSEISNGEGYGTHNSLRPLAPADSGIQISHVHVNGVDPVQPVGSDGTTSDGSVATLMAVNEDGKATNPVVVQVTKSGRPLRAAAVVVNGVSAKTDASGWATVQVPFSMSSSDFEKRSDLDIQVSDGSLKASETVENWLCRRTSGSVGAPILTQKALDVLNDRGSVTTEVRNFWERLMQSTPGVDRSQAVVRFIRADGRENAMAFLTAAGTLDSHGELRVPVGAPMLGVFMPSVAGGIKPVAEVRACCQNAVTSNSPPSVAAPTAPPSGPQPVATPTPTRAPTPVPPKPTPSKDPGTGTSNNYGGGVSPTATPAPTNPPLPSGSGTGTVTVTGAGCVATADGGSCTVSWRSDLQSQVRAWIWCNGNHQVGGTLNGAGPYTTTFTYIKGNWSCQAYASDGTRSVSRQFTLVVP